MTTYRRRGHWRRGRDGQRHWVSSRTVHRSGGRATSGGPIRASWRSPRPAPARRSSSTWVAKAYSVRWARHNAQCPVCGALVYFYANEHGSRVFFDELGPPWPKHPCTDRAQTDRIRGASPAVRAAPWAYPAPKGRRIRSQASRTGELLSALDYGDRYGVSPLAAWLVVEVSREDAATRLSLGPLYGRVRVSVFLAMEQVAVIPGDIVFIDNNVLSFMDLEHLEVRNVPVSVPEGGPAGVRAVRWLRGRLWAMPNR